MESTNVKSVNAIATFRVLEVLAQWVQLRELAQHSTNDAAIATCLTWMRPDQEWPHLVPELQNVVVLFLADRNV